MSRCRPGRARRRGRMVVLAVSLVAAACSGSDDSTSVPPEPALASTTTGAAATSSMPALDPSVSSGVAPVAGPVATFTTTDGLPGDDVLAVDVANDGTTWTAVRGPSGAVTFARLDPTGWTTFDPPSRVVAEGAPGLGGKVLVAGPGGTAWVVGGGFDLFVVVWQHDGERWIVHHDCTDDGIERGDCRPGAAPEPVEAEVAADGSLWGVGFAVIDGELGCALVRFDGTSWTTSPGPVDLCPLGRSSLGRTGDDLVLFTGGGLYRLDGREWVAVPSESEFPFSPERPPVTWAGGPGDVVWAVDADPTAGTLAWERFDGSSWSRLPVDVVSLDLDRACLESRSEAPGVAGHDVDAVLADPVARLTAYGSLVAGMAVTPDGAVWTAVSCGGLVEARPDGTAETSLTVADGLPSQQFRGLAAGPEGDLWVATDAGVSRITPPTG